MRGHTRVILVLGSLSVLACGLFSACSSNNNSNGGTDGGSTSSGSGSSSGGTTSTGSSGTTSSGGTSSGGAPDAGPDATETDGSTEGGCVTSLASLSDAGTLLFAFDDGGIGGWELNITDKTDAGVTGLIASSTQGHTCPGSLELNAGINAYTNPHEAANATYGFADPGTPVTMTSMHFWLKAQVPSDVDGSAGAYNTFNVQPFWNGHVGDAGRYSTGQYTVNSFGTNFMDGQWHELVVPVTTLADGGPASFALDSIAAQVYSFTAPPNDAAAPGPSPVTLLVDDIWFE